MTWMAVKIRCHRANNNNNIIIKDFVSLGRHSWRCRGRRTQQQSSGSDIRNFGNDQDSNFERSSLTIEPSLQQSSVANIHHVYCGCGKHVKDFAVLKHTNAPVAL